MHRATELILAATALFYCFALYVHGSVVDEPNTPTEFGLLALAAVQTVVHGAVVLMPTKFAPPYAGVDTVLAVAAIAAVETILTVAAIVQLWTVAVYRSSRWLLPYWLNRDEPAIMSTSVRRLYLSGVPSASWLWVVGLAALYLRITAADDAPAYLRLRHSRWPRRLALGGAVACSVGCILLCSSLLFEVGASRCAASLCVADVGCVGSSVGDSLEHQLLRDSDKATFCNAKSKAIPWQAVALGHHVGADSVAQAAVDAGIASACALLATLVPLAAGHDLVRTQWAMRVMEFMGCVAIYWTGTIYGRLNGWGLGANDRHTVTAIYGSPLVLLSGLASIMAGMQVLFIFWLRLLGVWKPAAEKTANGRGV